MTSIGTQLSCDKVAINFIAKIESDAVAFLITWHTSELIIWRTGCEKVCGVQIPAEILGFRRS
jgi:hypothetical protein